MKLPIDDDHRLRPHLRRQPVERRRSPKQAVAEAETAVVAPGGGGFDGLALRGIPAISRAMASSAIRGTDPLQAVLDREERRDRRRF